jgi:transmembrane sensor
LSDRSEIPEPAADLTDIAAGWLASLDAGTADRRAFEAWRAEDVRHAVAFAEVASTWRDMSELARISGDPKPAVPDDPPAPAPDEQPTRRRMLRIAAAAGAMALAGGGFAMRAAARNSAETRIGERRAISEVPGLSVNLNTDSSIYWKGGKSPRLWLERGEIGIQLDPGRRLSLMTPGGTFHLAPGDYNARLRGSSCELAVLSGSGTLGDAARPFQPGDVALATAGQANVRQRETDLTRITAWRRDTLVLNGESLDYALAEMNRYLRGKIVIGDPDLSRLRIGGTFATTNPTEFLEALRTSFGVKATAGADGNIVLTHA